MSVLAQLSESRAGRGKRASLPPWIRAERIRCVDYWTVRLSSWGEAELKGVVR